MSLDVYLEIKGAKIASEQKIYIREDGQTKEISYDEWNKLHPDLEPVTYQSEESDIVYSANITHNLNTMADEAKIYEPLWRPDEIGIDKANQLIEPLSKGLDLLKSDPICFKKFNPDNGWGNYEGLVKFVEDYLEACKEYPDATVRVWR